MCPHLAAMASAAISASSPFALATCHATCSLRRPRLLCASPARTLRRRTRATTSRSASWSTTTATCRAAWPARPGTLACKRAMCALEGGKACACLDCAELRRNALADHPRVGDGGLQHVEHLAPAPPPPPHVGARAGRSMHASPVVAAGHIWLVAYAYIIK